MNCFCEAEYDETVERLQGFLGEGLAVEVGADLYIVDIEDYSPGGKDGHGVFLSKVGLT